MLKSLVIIFSVLLGIGMIVTAWFLFQFYRVAGGDGYSPVDKEVSDQYYTKADQVYFVMMGNFFELGAQKVEGADISTFSVQSNEYARDSKHIYFNGKVVETIDYDSFELLSRLYAKDKNAVYIYGKREERADVLSFEVLGFDVPDSKIQSDSYYAKDKNSVWYFHNIVKGADPESFKALSDPKSGEDDHHIYNDGHAVEQI
ncbi:DKNYY domain-containing protein [Thalassolituus sp.]|uniref:DKNYY domain-containing protein n=1 Tax=Thalassolituus sp. TaxID=2030822 RepID=UPI0035159D95